jgi:uncharacterized OB-fold protein
LSAIESRMSRNGVGESGVRFDGRAGFEAILLAWTNPKIKCIDCYKDMNDWVLLPGTGTVDTFTVVNYAEPGLHLKKAPFVYAVIKMDGADTGLVHMIDGIAPEKVKVGMRVKAVLAKERDGHITDIKHFKPIA